MNPISRPVVCASAAVGYVMDIGKFGFSNSCARLRARNGAICLCLRCRMTSRTETRTGTALEWHYPAKLQPLTEPCRYKDAVGGRGGAKSHFFAEMGILKMFADRKRLVGIREVQLSLRDSIRQLMIDKIAKFGLQSAFDVTDNELRCKRTGSLGIFRGMQSYNADTIKSLEGFDIALVEEAQSLSQHSLDILRPTIRNEGSEIWFARNRRLRTDAVDVFMRQNAGQPGFRSVEINWNDNPWFPDVLRRDMLRDFEVDPEMAEHIWNGAYGMQHGAILSRLVDRAEREGRIRDDVEYDPRGPGVEITSDIGRRDTASWWFWQRRVDGYSLIDYDGDSGLQAEDWCDRLQERLDERGWPLAKVWLPHDALNKTFAAKYTAEEQFVSKFGIRHCGVVPKSTITDRVNAGRTIIGRCEFNATRCAVGLEGLRAWRYEWNPELQTFSKEPVHDKASHPSDGYTYGCQVMETTPVPEIPVAVPLRGLNAMTFDEILAHQAKRERRV